MAGLHWAPAADTPAAACAVRFAQPHQSNSHPPRCGRRTVRLARSLLAWTRSAEVGGSVQPAGAKRRSAREAEHLIRRRRTSEVAQWALANVDLKPFIYVYDLPPEYNEAFKALPAGWHSDQYDCALPALCRAVALSHRS